MNEADIRASRLEFVNMALGDNGIEHETLLNALRFMAWRIHGFREDGHEYMDRFFKHRALKRQLQTAENARTPS
jgi:hypothetical protein